MHVCTANVKQGVNNAYKFVLFKTIENMNEQKCTVHKTGKGNNIHVLNQLTMLDVAYDIILLPYTLALIHLICIK